MVVDLMSWCLVKQISARQSRRRLEAPAGARIVRRNEAAQVRDDLVGLTQYTGIIDPKRKHPGRDDGVHACDRVLNANAIRRVGAERVRRRQKDFGFGFAACDVVGVDDVVERRGDAQLRQHVRCVLARGTRQPSARADSRAASAPGSRSAGVIVWIRRT